MNWGIIGTGNMGNVLLHALTSSQAVPQKNMYLYNRTFMKAYTLKENYPDVHVVQTVETLAKDCDIILLCAKPKQIVEIAKKIKPIVKPEQFVVSITSSVSVENLDSILPCSVARMIPSITNRALSGVTLLTFPEGYDQDKKEVLLQSCKLFSTPVEIEEQHVRIASDIVSCGPAFLSFLLEDMIQAAQQKTGIPKDQATTLVEQMIIGFGKLFEDNIYNFTSLKEKVMVKGGITGEGMKALEQSYNDIFTDVFNATHNKFYHEKDNIDELVNQINVK
ncbi:late competence protein ComER [Tenuibacillus multivorans]|uniref:Competence protein ComER n=1 Tax=Tenuibacillus multivorans TaxID=237069 RepID=A0A1G9ZHS9_9BACI|nr:late competence protein ComER [Tenuibacillus multivorans]GEL78343.1 pyrroline-5-carboxylate reductase [Tenuibacillus multivorans]SDN20053.1 competence protein ComER [Tenuibacillus multivorans]